MRITKTQIDKISGLILQRLKDKDLIVFKTDEAVVLERVITAILDDMKAEDELDREVEGMLKAHTEEIEAGRIDYRRMFSMIKGKLVRERGLTI
jgi:hypothetical protein